MKKVWDVIKFVGRLFFKPRTTFKNCKIALICLLDFILIVNLLTVIIVIFSIAIGFFIWEVTLPLLIVPIVTILLLALTSLVSRYKRVFLTCGIALPIILWIMIPVAFNKISEAPVNYFASPSSIAIDSNGNLYSLCGIRSPNIFKFNPDGRLIAKFRVETGMEKIAVDSKGKIYVTIWKNREEGKWVKLDPEGQIVTERPIKLERMHDLAVAGAGNVYILNKWGKNFRQRWVRIFSSEEKFFSTIGKGFCKEKATEPLRPYMPWAITLDKEKNLYIASFLGQIFKFDHTGQLLEMVYEDLDPRKTPFRFLMAVDVDEEGYIYVVYTKGGTIPPTTLPIVKLSPGGERIRVFDYPSQEFDFISEINVDGEGNVYAIDSFESKILKFDKDGNLLLSIAPSNFWARLRSKIVYKSALLVGKGAGRKCGRKAMELCGK
jgi:sugar lactone lactonase YvrE